MSVRSLLVIISMFFISGCATTPKPTASVKDNNLQIRVSELERQVAQRDQAIEELKYEVKELAYQVENFDSASVIEPTNIFESSRTSLKKTSKKKSNKTVKNKIIRVEVAPKMIQTALKNAGYYNGAIDGKIGANTQKAIKAFQKDHDLKSDGIIGKNTWTEMKSYLE